MAEPNIDIVIDCADPEALAAFWAEALGYTNAGFFDPTSCCCHPSARIRP